MVDTRQVEQLPLNGRDFRKLAFLVPGAAPRSPRGSLGSFTANGQREKSNIFLIDGVDNNDSFRNQPSFNQGGVSARRPRCSPSTRWPNSVFRLRAPPSTDAIREPWSTRSSSPARTSSRNAYEFLRHDKLNSRNFFETLPGARRVRSRTATTAGRSAARSSADRTFFFAGFEGRARPPQLDARRNRARRRGHRVRPGRERGRRPARECPRREASSASSRRRTIPAPGPTTSTAFPTSRQRQFPGKDRSPFQRPVQPQRPLRVRRRQPDLSAEYWARIAARQLSDCGPTRVQLAG